MGQLRAIWEYQLLSFNLRAGSHAGSRRHLVRFMDRNFIIGTLGLGLVALGVATVSKHRAVEEESAVVTRSTVEQRRPLSQPRLLLDAPPAPKHKSPSPIEDRRDDALLAHVEHKYRYLFADVEGTHVDELKRRVLEREANEDSERRASIDASIGELLPPREFAYYQALKDSDFEQHHLTEYVGGISNVAPLDSQQERAVLDAKLRQKQGYATTLRDAGLDRDMLSASEREYAHAHAAKTLKSHLDDYLLEVSPSLNPDQYSLLRNYETTELARELELLQRLIDAK
jgi:hypothetical protein